jgi:hypothetical protein
VKEPLLPGRVDDESVPLRAVHSYDGSPRNASGSGLLAGGRSSPLVAHRLPRPTHLGRATAVHDRAFPPRGAFVSRAIKIVIAVYHCFSFRFGRVRYGAYACGLAGLPSSIPWTWHQSEHARPRAIREDQSSSGHESEVRLVSKSCPLFYTTIYARRRPLRPNQGSRFLQAPETSD